MMDRDTFAAKLRAAFDTKMRAMEQRHDRIARERSDEAPLESLAVNDDPELAFMRGYVAALKSAGRLVDGLVDLDDARADGNGEAIEQLRVFRTAVSTWTEEEARNGR